MAGYLQRLAERTLNLAAVVRPLTAMAFGEEFTPVTGYLPVSAADAKRTNRPARGDSSGLIQVDDAPVSTAQPDNPGDSAAFMENTRPSLSKSVEPDKSRTNPASAQISDEKPAAEVTGEAGSATSDCEPKPTKTLVDVQSSRSDSLNTLDMHRESQPDLPSSEELKEPTRSVSARPTEPTRPINMVTTERESLEHGESSGRRRESTRASDNTASDRDVWETSASTRLRAKSPPIIHSPSNERDTRMNAVRSRKRAETADGNRNHAIRENADVDTGPVRSPGESIDRADSTGKEQGFRASDLRSRRPLVSTAAIEGLEKERTERDSTAPYGHLPSSIQAGERARNMQIEQDQTAVTGSDTHPARLVSHTAVDRYPGLSSLRRPRFSAAVPEHPEEPPIVKVSIGRLEVRSASPTMSPAPKKTARRGPRVTLSEYLKKRDGGER